MNYEYLYLLGHHITEKIFSLSIFSCVEMFSKNHQQSYNEIMSIHIDTVVLG